MLRFLIVFFIVLSITALFLYVLHAMRMEGESKRLPMFVAVGGLLLMLAPVLYYWMQGESLDHIFAAKSMLLLYAPLTLFFLKLDAIQRAKTFEDTEDF